MKPKIKHRRIYIQKDPEVQKLAHSIGQFIEYWGFKSIQGRMWFYLYVSEEPLSSIELAEILRISPSLVTQSVQILLKYRVILLAEKGVNGVLRYQANPRPEQAIQFALENRELPLLKETKKRSSAARKALSRGSKSGLQISSERVEKIEDWSTMFQLMLETGITLLQSPSSPFSLLSPLSKSP